MTNDDGPTFDFDVAETADQEETVAEENGDDENESADDQESGLLDLAKAKVLAVVAWLRAEFDQALEEIAPQLRGAFSAVSIPSGAIKPVGLAVVLLVAAVAVPAADLGGSDSTAIETDEEPVEGTTYDGPEEVSASESTSYNAPGEADYRRVVESAVGTAETDAPEPPSDVKASAGTQTMSVETTVVDGEPALVLEDDRTHSGRWVSVPTSWFEESIGEVPNAARIAHDESGTYAAPLMVRGDSAAFYVKEFSTNTVTFNGEISLSGVEADDGTQYQYDLDATNVDDPSINLTGVETTQAGSASAVQSGSGSTSFTVGGTTTPRNEQVTLTGIEETSSGSLSPGTVSNGYSTTIDIGGNQPAESGTVTFTGKEETTARSASGTLSDTTSDSITINGNQDVTVDITVSPKEVSASGGTETDKYNTKEVNTSNMDQFTAISMQMGGTYELIKLYDSNDNQFHYGRIDSGETLTQFDRPIGDHLAVQGNEDWSDIGTIYVDGEAHAESATVSVGSQSASFGTVDGTYTKSVTLSPGTHSVDLSTSNGRRVNYDLSWTDKTVSDNPSVSIGGSTASVSGTLAGGETATKSISLSPGSSQSVSVSTGGNVGVEASWTEVTATEDPSVTVGGSTVSHSGVLGPGSTVTESVDLSTGTESADISTGGKVGVDFEWTERTETRDPAVTVNGATESYSGSLADGETTSISIPSSALENGTNTVSISTNSPTYGPSSLVTFDYSHGAEASTTATVSESTWSSNATVSRTWPSEQSNATATLPMNERVVDVRNIEIRFNGTTWDQLAENEYRMNGTEIVVDLGTVSAGTVTDIRATGSKARVEDGSITVLEPTTNSSKSLETRVRVDEAGPNFSINVDSTALSERVHYQESSTWESAGETVITAEGSQRLKLPNAAPGGETTVRTYPVKVSAARDKVTVAGVTGDRSSPGLKVRGNGYADVDYTFVDAKDATPYILYSTTKDIVRDEGLASSPITLTDDNSDETLVFRIDDGTASGSGSGSNSAVSGVPMETAQEGFSAFRGLLPSNPLYVLLGLLGLSAGVVAVRRSGVVDEGTRGGAAVDVGQEVARTAGGILERLLENELVVGALVLAGGAWVLTSGVLSEEATLIVSLAAVPVALFLALQQFDRFDMRIWLGSTALVAVFGLQALAPELGATIVEEAGVILTVGGLLIAWRVVSAFRAEAETPDQVTRVELETEDND
jgi:hypothetical protein